MVLIQWQDNLKYIVCIYLCEYLICQLAVFVRNLLERQFLIKSLKLLIKNKFYLGHYSEKQVLNGKKLIQGILMGLTWLSRIGNQFLFLQIMHVTMVALSQKHANSKSLLKMFGWQLEKF